MIHENLLWIGTGGASFHLFRLSSPTIPDEKIQKLVKLRERYTSRFEEKLSQSSVRARPESTDEGLVNEKNLVMTISPGEHTDKHLREGSDKNASENPPSRLSRRAFGKTFYRQIRREMPQELRRDGLYKLDHLWSGIVSDDGKEAAKVTAIKPIIR